MQLVLFVLQWFCVLPTVLFSCSQCPNFLCLGPNGFFSTPFLSEAASHVPSQSSHPCTPSSPTTTYNFFAALCLTKQRARGSRLLLLLSLQVC